MNYPITVTITLTESDEAIDVKIEHSNGDEPEVTTINILATWTKYYLSAMVGEAQKMSELVNHTINKK